jgi:hypothetical protein
MSYFKIFFYKKYLQVLEDLRTIWNWILTEKLHINPRDRGLYSAILVLGETFDNRGIFLFIQQNFSVQGGSWYKLGMQNTKGFIHFLLIIDDFLGFVSELMSLAIP